MKYGGVWCFVSIVWLFVPLEILGKAVLKFHVAPMQAYTNQHLRHFYSMLHPSAWLWTEMEKPQDLLRSDDAFQRRLSPTTTKSQNNNPCVLQLGGSDENELQQCIQKVITSSLSLHYDEINLNCGCPSVESGGSSQYGAALMKDPQWIKHLLSSMREEVKRCCCCGDNDTIPISIKIRIAAHDTFHPEKEESYQDLIDFVQQIIMEDDDALHVIVHARSAILSGLSPSKNRSVPPLKQSFVHQLAHDMPNLRITLNGGISSLLQLDQVVHTAARTKIDGVMVGRWLLRSPLDLLDIYYYMNQHDCNLQQFQNCHPKHTLTQERVTAILSYGDYAYEQLQNGVYSPSDILSPLCLVAFQLQDQMDALDEKFDELTTTTINNNDPNTLRQLQMEDECIDILQTALFDAVSNAVENDKYNNNNNNNKQRNHDDSNKSIKTTIKIIQRTIGKKVFNKLKRNRNEI